MLTLEQINEELAHEAEGDAEYVYVPKELWVASLVTARKALQWLEATHYPSPSSGDPSYTRWSEAHSEYIDWLEGEGEDCD